MDQRVVCHEGVRWREVGDEPTSSVAWPRNDRRPEAGEVRWIHPLELWDIAIGTRAWCLFEPDGAVFNGLATSPKELDEAGVVEIEVLERREIEPEPVDNPNNFFHDIQTQKEWLRVRCWRSVLLSHVQANFPQMNDGLWLLPDQAKWYQSTTMWVCQHSEYETNTTLFFTRTELPCLVLAREHTPVETECFILNIPYSGELLARIGTRTSLPL